MSEPAIVQIEHLSKSFGTLKALCSANLEIPQGSFFGLLGPNGAGKSTLINILSSLLMKDQGRVEVAGFDLDQNPAQLKQSLGVVPQEFNFSFFETCEQIVCFQAGYYGIPYKVALERSKLLFEQLELSNKRHAPAMRLSGGMKRRLMIARALIHRPKVLILDEPTAGVDIAIRKSMWSLLRKLNAEGTTIILTTHYLEEAEELCERLAFINKGHIIKEGRTKELLADLACEQIHLVCDQITSLPQNPAYGLTKVGTKELRAFVGKEVSLSQLIYYLKDYGIDVKKVQTKHSRLEELFLQVLEEPSLPK